MPRNASERDSENSARTKAGTTAASVSSVKRNDTPSKPITSRSKSSFNGKPRVLETRPAVKDSGASSEVVERPLVQKQGIKRDRDPSVHHSTDSAPPGNRRAGPRSASSSGSPSDQDNPRHGVSSLISSFGTTMSDPTKNGATPETRREDESLLERQALDLRIRPNEDFWPRRIVALQIYADPPLIHDGHGPPLSRQEFLQKNRARKRKTAMFAIIRTYGRYSLAVCIHTFDPNDAKGRDRLSEDLAIICSSTSGAGPVQSVEPLANPTIQVESYGDLELPEGSRLDYSDTFIVEYNVRVAFIGEITMSCWPAFAKSYEKVQLAHGRYVLPPTLLPHGRPRRSSESSSGNRGVPLEPSLPDEEISAIQEQLEQLRQRCDVSPPSFGGPSSPESLTGVQRTESYQNTAGNASWIARETPYKLPGIVDVGGIRTERTTQGTFGRQYNGCAPGNGLREMEYEALRNSLVLAHKTDEKKAASKLWIDNARKGQEQMMKTAGRRGLTREALDTPRGAQDARTFLASPVKVAILDDAVDIDSQVFTAYRKSGRLKEYKDFSETPETPDPDTHGTHVTNLLLHMAPEADVYVAQAFAGQDSLFEAIYHATEVWKVDIITMSLTYDAFGANNDLGADESLIDALAYARHNNITIFSAVHNEGPDHAVVYPARAPTVYPVFSMNHNNIPSDFTPDATPGRLNLGALGERIDPFWMQPLFKAFRNSSLETISGSSFAAPIAAGAWASTLLVARLIHHRHPYMPISKLLRNEKVVEAILKMLSVQASCHPLRKLPKGSESTKGHSLSTRSMQPCPLWTDPEVLGKIKGVFDEFAGLEGGLAISAKEAAH